MKSWSISSSVNCWRLPGFVISGSLDNSKRKFSGLATKILPILYTPLINPLKCSLKLRLSDLSHFLKLSPIVSAFSSISSSINYGSSRSYLRWLKSRFIFKAIALINGWYLRCESDDLRWFWNSSDSSGFNSWEGRGGFRFLILTDASNWTDFFVLSVLLLKTSS